MGKNKKHDMVFLLVYPVIGALLSHLFRINGFMSVIVFLGVPSIYLTFRAIECAKRSMIFSLVLGPPLIVIIDYISHLTGQWVIPDSILPFRLFNFVTIEVIFWSVLNLYVVVMFYEYFLHHHITKKLWHPRMKYLVVISFALLSTFVTVYSVAPAFLNIPFFYLSFGLVLFVIPLIAQLFEYPKFIAKFFETAAYFFYSTFIYEITALQLGWWDFPGKEFIGWVYVFGLRFPVEELVFYLMLFAMAILTYYEFFDEKEK